MFRSGGRGRCGSSGFGRVAFRWRDSANKNGCRRTRSTTGRSVLDRPRPGRRRRAIRQSPRRSRPSVKHAHDGRDRAARPWCVSRWNAAVEVSVPADCLDAIRCLAECLAARAGGTLRRVPGSRREFVTGKAQRCCPRRFCLPWGRRRSTCTPSLPICERASTGSTPSCSPSSDATSAAGDVFLFLNRRLDRIKLIHWDRDGLAIWMKRLERGTFQRPRGPPSGAQVEMDATDLALLLSGIELASVKRRPRYSFDAAKRTALETRRLVTAGASRCRKIFCRILPIWAYLLWRIFGDLVIIMSHDRAARDSQRS